METSTRSSGQRAEGGVVADQALAVAEQAAGQGEEADTDHGHAERGDRGVLGGAGDQPTRRGQQPDPGPDGCRAEQAGEDEPPEPSVLVENKSGAASNIATEAVINAAPDGYTLAAVTSANAINATTNKRTLTFDFLNQLAPVAGLAQGPSVMVVHPSVPANSVAEFIAYAKANPGKINMGTPGIGTTGHMAGELFKAMAGVDLVHVPYRGSAPAVTDLIGGQVQVMFDAMISTLPQIQSGKIRALAVTTATRSASCRRCRRSPRPLRVTRPSSGTASACRAARRPRWWRS